MAPPAVADALRQVFVNDDRSAFERAETVLSALWCDANEAPQGGKICVAGFQRFRHALLCLEQVKVCGSYKDVSRIGRAKVTVN
jgi:hypothetical protein